MESTCFDCGSREFAHRIEECARNREDVTLWGVDYMPYPLDADGKAIHIGDVMDGVNKHDPLRKVMGKVIEVSFEDNDTVSVAVQAWSSDGKSWHRAYLDPYAVPYCHHHAPTVEDVLREFGAGWYEQMSGPETFDIADYVERYAARLRLAGEDA